MRYGSTEFAYAEPFANALANDKAFRSWVLQHTKFADVADEARLLDIEMKDARSTTAQTWWRSHYTEKCKCQGCSGQETDLLAIFEDSTKRFALHVEVKQPTDRFPSKKDQAQNYAIRAQCWVASPPKAILRHQDAATVLLCSASKLIEYAPHLTKFGTVITFEDVVEHFPNDAFAAYSTLKKTSKKSTGSHLLVPDQPVSHFSPELNSYYEMLRRYWLILEEIPQIEIIDSLKPTMKTLFYDMREHLEVDGGIRPETIESQPPPTTTGVLETLHGWEEDHEKAVKEYENRCSRPDQRLQYPGMYRAYWTELRWTIFECQRCLQITAERIATDVPPKWSYPKPTTAK